MNWSEDYECPNDHIYAMERQKDIEAAMYRWEEEQESKNRLPAIIKVVTPITNEVSNRPSAVRGTNQKRL